MDRTEKALEYFYSGYNCSQSVVMAYADLFGLNEKTAEAIASGFGGGMGALRDKCGTVTGMFMLAGLAHQGYDRENPRDKKELYDQIQNLNQEFEKEFGTSCCRELLLNAKCIVKDHPSERDAKYYQKRPCARFVESACGIIERVLLPAAE